MPAGDDGVGVSIGRVVFVGWGISVGSVVSDSHGVLARFGVFDDTSTATAVLMDSAVTIKVRFYRNQEFWCNRRDCDKTG
jgi:hypothetical protein